VVSGSCIGAFGGYQCHGIKGTGEHVRTDAANTVGKHFGTHAADALEEHFSTDATHTVGEHFGADAPNALEVVTGISR